jgi:hypothetical protein
LEEDSDDEEFLADLPTDAEAEEATAKKRAILASFETWHRDASAQQFMAAERRAAAARLADKQLPPAPTPIAVTSKRRGLRWRRLRNASPRWTEPGAWRRWRRSASIASMSTLFLPSTHRPSDRRNA